MSDDAASIAAYVRLFMRMDLSLSDRGVGSPTIITSKPSVGSAN